MQLSGQAGLTLVMGVLLLFVAVGFAGSEVGLVPGAGVGLCALVGPAAVRTL